jgi:hypothetical protein
VGHYRSEMGYEESDREEEIRRKKNLKRATKYIEKQIEEKGVAQVLAEIVTKDRYVIPEKF